jgi:hypoxanthine-guanine phosphoribosyltransferase
MEEYSPKLFIIREQISRGGAKLVAYVGRYCRNKNLILLGTLKRSFVSLRDLICVLGISHHPYG